MSTHRKIEYALFVLGLAGLALALLPQSRADITTLGLFAISALFAGLHVFHLYDGKSANTIVSWASIAGTAYGVYWIVTTYLGRTLEPWAVIFFGLFFITMLLALRLRRDFITTA